MTEKTTSESISLKTKLNICLRSAPIIFLIPIFGLSPFLFLAAIAFRSIIFSFYMPKIGTVLDIIIKPHEKIRASAYSVVEIVRDSTSALAVFAASFIALGEISSVKEYPVWSPFRTLIPTPKSILE